jgi:propanol-preferring alcohol dehydrogenase
MRAAILRALGEPVAIEACATPEIGSGEVLVKVHACGLCHSDLHIARGDWEMLKPITKLPLIPGHEIAGTIAAVGPDVAEVAVGDRVGVPWLHWTCGQCEFCRSGQEVLCGKQKITGVTVDGGFAEYVKAPASHVAKLPDSLSFTEAAPLLCAGLTVYRALKRSQLSAGQRLAVFGAGGLGHLAIQVAKQMGAEAGAIDIADDKLTLAQECGADWTINSNVTPPHKKLRELGGAHVVMVTSGSRAAYEAGLRAMRKGGTLAVVGMSPDPVPVSTVALVALEARIVASSVGTRDDLRDLLAMAASGKVRCHAETRPLEAAPEALAQMHAGSLVGRVVLQP